MNWGVDSEPLSKMVCEEACVVSTLSSPVQGKLNVLLFYDPLRQGLFLLCFDR